MVEPSFSMLGAINSCIDSAKFLKLPGFAATFTCAAIVYVQYMKNSRCLKQAQKIFSKTLYLDKTVGASKGKKNEVGCLLLDKHTDNGTQQLLLRGENLYN